MKRPALIAGAALWTWLWLFPLSGFHHMYRCGLLGWAILDNEGEAFEVRWSAVLLALSLAFWLGGVLLLRRWARGRS